MTLAILLIVVGLIVLVAAALRPPGCPGCGSRHSVPILLADAVRCGRCWERLA